jgi:hypothetical protein
MMELGNILFNHARGGRFPIERGVGYEDALQLLFDAYSPTRDKSWRDYGDEFENGTFVIWPYSWCDCDCGFDDKERAWCDANSHSDDCYLQALRRQMERWDLMHDYKTIEKACRCDVVEVSSETILGVPMQITKASRSEAVEKAHDAWCALYKLRKAAETKAAKDLCRLMGIKWNNGRGSLVHCTCSHDSNYSDWRSSNDHHPACSATRPNFLVKKTGFWMTWYKYPLRDAYASEKVSVSGLRAIVRDCISSLSTDKGGRVLRLKDAKENMA